MSIISVRVTNKVPRLVNQAKIVCNNSDYQIVFSFDSEWSEFTTKTARFIWNGEYADVSFTGNTVAVPMLQNTTGVYVGLYAGDLHTTEAMYIPCEPSIICKGGTEAEAPGPIERGLPAGGSAGQVLSKASGESYDVEWMDPAAGGGSSVTVDAELIEGSENPVQSKVIQSALAGKQPLGSYVKTVNGATPDENGNVEVESGGSGGTTDYTDLENKPKINGVELTGDKTAEELGVGSPSDEQVASAVSAWLDEHPEATTSVADGSITPKKLSFYDDGLQYVDVGALALTEQITQTAAQGIGIYYAGYLSEPIPVNGADHCYLKTPGRTSSIAVSQYVTVCPVFYDVDGNWLTSGNVEGVYQDFGKYNGNYKYFSTFDGFHIPDGCSYIRMFSRYEDSLADMTLYFSFKDMVEKKAWQNDTTDEIKEQWGVVDGVYRNLLNISGNHGLKITSKAGFPGFYELPSDWSGIVNKSASDVMVFLNPVETRGFKEIYCRFTNAQSSRANWELYFNVGFLLYDYGMNYIGQLSVDNGAVDGVAECHLVKYVGTEQTNHYYKLTVGETVAYVFLVANYDKGQITEIETTGCMSYSPFDITESKENVGMAEFSRPVRLGVEKAIDENTYYRFQQIGKLIDQKEIKYMAWNHNRMHYDATRNKFVMAFRGSNAHAGSTTGAIFTTIDPLTYKAGESVAITDGTNTLQTVYGFVLDDSDNYMVFGPVEQNSAVVYKFESTNGGTTWTNAGAITVDSSGATNANASTYNYTWFYSMYRLSDGTLLASYDDVVSPKDKKYGFVARSTDGGLNWNLIEVLPAASTASMSIGPCEQCFFEIDGTVIAIGRVNHYNLSYRDVPYNAVLMYSTDSGETWTGYGYSDRIQNHCQTVAAFEHDGIVEVLAMDRDYNASSAESVGRINHYSCTKSEALNDGFKLREVFYSQSKVSADFAGIALAQDKYGNVLVAYSDSTPEASTITSPHFMVGASGGVRTPCCDGIASDKLPYSGEKVEALIAALRAELSGT